MKKFYEAPVAEELYADAPALMNGAPLSGDSDGSGQDLSWGLI